MTELKWEDCKGPEFRVLEPGSRIWEDHARIRKCGKVWLYTDDFEPKPFVIKNAAVDVLRKERRLG